jgi:hypothetical protein
VGLGFVWHWPVVRGLAFRCRMAQFAEGDLSRSIGAGHGCRGLTCPPESMRTACRADAASRSLLVPRRSGVRGSVAVERAAACRVTGAWLTHHLRM